MIQQGRATLSTNTARKHIVKKTAGEGEKISEMSIVRAPLAHHRSWAQPRMGEIHQRLQAEDVNRKGD